MSEGKQVATVEYQIGTYLGLVQVDCLRDDDNDLIIARAKAKVNRLYGPTSMPMYYEHWNITDRRDT